MCRFWYPPAWLGVCEGGHCTFLTAARWGNFGVAIRFACTGAAAEETGVEVFDLSPSSPVALFRGEVVRTCSHDATRPLCCKGNRFELCDGGVEGAVGGCDFVSEGSDCTSALATTHGCLSTWSSGRRWDGSRFSSRRTKSTTKGGKPGGKKMAIFKILSMSIVWFVLWKGGRPTIIS